MTRINCVPVKELCNKHLIAEYRELPRVFKLARKCSVPKHYTLGTGHVKFFYNKLLFLYKRSEDIYSECCYRNFKVRYKPWTFLQLDLPECLWNDWTPTLRDIKLNRKRIEDRKKKFKSSNGSTIKILERKYEQ